MSPALANFLFESANLLLLAAGLGWVLFRPVRRALDAERARHQKQEVELTRLREEAEVLAREARGAREAAEREAAERREELLKQARTDAEQVLERARKQARTERQGLEAELQGVRAAQAEALADLVAAMSAAAVRRLLETVDGPSLDAALVRGACEELRGLDGAARGSVRVECARPLDADSRALLEAALGSGFEASVATELGAGVRVTTGAGQVDATALSLARTAAMQVAARGREGASAPAEPADG